MGFSDTLRAARQEKGLTQQEVARVLEVDKTTYSGYETGRRQPDVGKLQKLARLLELSGDQLLGLPPPGRQRPDPGGAGEAQTLPAAGCPTAGSWWTWSWRRSTSA